eukprot:328892-Prymnesium_polylepis.1
MRKQEVKSRSQGAEGPHDCRGDVAFATFRTWPPVKCQRGSELSLSRHISSLANYAVCSATVCSAVACSAVACFATASI